MDNFRNYNGISPYSNNSFDNYNLGYGSANSTIIPGSNSSNDRFIGAGFAFPFLLGGVTGAAIAPAFWRPPYNRPYGPGFYGPGFYGPYRPF